MQQTKKAGIWGLGIVGKSLIRYLHKQGYELGVMDKRAPNPEEQEFLRKHNVQIYHEDCKERFFVEYEVIIPSAGIDLRPYAAYNRAWLSELDLFHMHATIPSIAITGTIGKTSITHLISLSLIHI